MLTTPEETEGVAGVDLPAMDSGNQP